jgi:hypothetical protein
MKALLHTLELLKWSESLTRTAATAHDKALDAEYLRTQIGSGDHRLLDAARDLIGAWEDVQRSTDADTMAQEVIGSVSALWKGLTLIKGLPLVTVDRTSFEQWADRIASAVPLVDRSHLVDLLSFDAFEVLATGLGAVGALFAFSQDDQQRLSEILGAMGIVAIIGANPLMGLVTVALAAYAFHKKRLRGRSVVKGAAVASVSAALFAVLGLPMLVELVIVIVVMKLVKEHVLEREDLADLLGRHLKRTGSSIGESLARLGAFVGFKSAPVFEPEPSATTTRARGGVPPAGQPTRRPGHGRRGGRRARRRDRRPGARARARQRGRRRPSRRGGRAADRGPRRQSGPRGA